MLVLGIAGASLAWAGTSAATFVTPSFLAPYGPGRFQNTVVWRAGDVQHIVYDTSDMKEISNYSIALWQQSLDDGAAVLGPVINRESPGHLECPDCVCLCDFSKLTNTSSGRSYNT